MPQFIVTAPDGKEYEINAPDGATQEQALEYAKQHFASQAPKEAQKEDTRPELQKRMANMVGGAVRGAGSIGATLLTPIDMLMGNTKSIGNPERRKAMDEALQSLGVDTNSMAFGAGKLASEVAGTLGVGPLLGVGAKALGATAPLVDSLASGGFAAGGATGLPAWAARVVGGAATGGASAGLVDPENAGTGAALSGALPLAAKASGEAGKLVAQGTHAAAKKLMQSAIKPTIKQLQTGEADTAIETLLQYGINPSKKGVEKLNALIDEKNAEIANALAGSNATINKFAALKPLSETARKFTNQVNPTADLNAISNAGVDFLSHPIYPGPTLPVQAAQDLKQGTYRVLAKKYGQVGPADTEAQKAIARGLKDEIAAAVPGISALNAEESRLLKTLSVAERRALMELNKNPVGLAALTTNPASWALFMADKSAAFKALAARMVNASGGSGLGLLENAAKTPALRGAGLLAISGDQ